MRCSIASKFWLVFVGPFAFCLFLLTPAFDLVAQSPPAVPGDVVINEIAWGGSAASSADEWIELHNTTDQPVDLTDWSLVSLDGTPSISLSGVIPAGAFFLLERTDDNAVSDIPADLIYTGALDNGGDELHLLAPDGALIDTANLGSGPWPAGSGSPDYHSMERVDALTPDAPDNWAGNDGVFRCGLDADGLPLNATPGQANSNTGPTPTSTLFPTATATSTPSTTVTPTVTGAPPTATAAPTLTPTSTITPTLIPVPSPGEVVVNEIGWGGTGANAADEWIELYNTTDQAIALDGWSLVALDGGPAIALSGVIPPGGYFILERTDDGTVSDIPADLIYTGGLSNEGETLQLLAPDGTLIDTANQGGGPWPAGSGSPDYFSMERTGPNLPDAPDNWSSNNGMMRNGLDANGDPLNGTPGQPNSPPIPTPTPVPTTVPGPPPSPGEVVINEVAWGGTAANAADEWIELYNTTGQAIALDGCSLVALDGEPVIDLVGVIPASGYFMLERTDDGTVSNVPADLFYTGGLGNDGEALQFLAPDGTLIDTANQGGGPWPAGSGSPDYYSMERTDPLAPDWAGNWSNNNGMMCNGIDANGDPLNGTPGGPNSPPVATPAPTPTPVPGPAPSPGEVIINEVAWGGNAANPADEWIELYNTTEGAITLTGCSLVAGDGAPSINLDGLIPPGGYFLLERTDDDTVSDVPADLYYTGGLSNDGEALQLLAPDGTLIDAANLGAGPWPAGDGWPGYYSMERIDCFLPDSPTNWASNNGLVRNGLDIDGNPLNGTPWQPNSTTVEDPIPTPSPTPPPTAPPGLLISEFLYDGVTPTTSGDEFVELCNAETEPIDLTGFKVGDEETGGEGESMYYLPDARLLGADECLVIAKNAEQFAARFGFYPDAELVVAGTGYTDTLAIPNLDRCMAWGRGVWGLADDGDELLVLDPADQLVDSVAYRNGNYAGIGVTPDASAPAPDSLQRVWPWDTNSMPADFVRQAPNPGSVTTPPDLPADTPPAAALPGDMHAYWGVLHAHSSYSDGAGPPLLAFATARANGLHFLAITDHGNQLAAGEWADTGMRAAQAGIPAGFVGLRGFEYTHPTDGHATVWNTAAFVSRDDAGYDTLPEFYAWLAAQSEALAGFNHPFRDADFHDFAYEPSVAPRLCTLEVGNGSERYGLYHTFEAGWIQALASGWQVAPANNSDTETAYWGADTAHRTGLVAPALTETDLLDALRARRVFATEDSNLALTLRSGEAWMGSVISASTTITFTVNVVDLDPVSEPITLTLYNRTLPVASSTHAATPAEWRVSVPGEPGHFYWVRAVQADGDVAQTAPLWTEGAAPPEMVVINEVVPAPNAIDWDGNGTADYQDEWIELLNMGDSCVGLGAWQVKDESGAAYSVPLGATLAPGEYLVLHRRETDLAFNNDADTLTLRRPDGTIADRHQYGDGPGYDVGLCRLPDGGADWHERCDPTPGGPNRPLPAAEAAGPVEASIFEARHMPLGSWVKIRGRVTVPPGVFSPRTAYLQDTYSGIKIYLPKDHRVWGELGDRWEVVGRVRTYHGELEIRVSERDDVRHLDSGDPPPPLPIGSGVMVEPYEGMLVMLEGWAVDFERGGGFWADDGTGWARVYLDRDTYIRRPWMEVGQPLHVVGIVSQYTNDDPPVGGYRLMPRYPFDLVIEEPLGTQDFEWPELLPETGRR